MTTAFGLSTTGTNIGTTVTVTDQANKQRRSITNALGQLTRVDEPNDAGLLDVNGVPAQSTNYSYDTLNNLVTVVQGQQTRTFTYDSLSRLKSANNPESGIINYVYDNNSNLTSKTDARQITTNYVYDNLNRVKNRNYSDNITPNVAYTYDNLPNAKGKLIKVNSSVSTTEYTNFDILGRVQNHKQRTDNNDYTTSYTYNLSGALIEETYPSGRVVKNTLDQDGDLQQVQSKKLNGTFQNYANAFTYTSAGAVSSMRLGNGKFENTTFNSRLQAIQIGLGSSATSQNLLKLNFDYGAIATENNGNVTKQTVTVPTEIRNNVTYNGFTATQNYTYDSLNRLKSAEETIPNQLGWKQTFIFDRYGNRTFDTTNNNTTTLANGCPVAICNPSANPQDNKLVGTNYDSVGNIKIDANGQVFTLDAENKQTKVVNAQGVTLGEYFYDGDGKRVKKIAPLTNETTIFVYDASGKTVAEYSTISANQADAKINYTTTDHLGSPRVITDATGNVIARHDTMPFGEEIQRANYGSDNLRNRFTSYERDGETNLDYAKARMFGSGVGRFTSPDDFLNDTKTIEPSSWNLYVYARNSPLKYIDPNGETVDGTGLSEEERTSLISGFASVTGYRIEDLSFGSNGLLSVASGARSNGGSARARTLLNEAINSNWEFVLVGVNTPDVAFAEHAPVPGSPRYTASGARQSHLIGQVRIDFADFNNAVFENESAKQSFSLGITILHEFVHGLYPNLSDRQGGGAGEIENNWINPIREELGLSTRDAYSAIFINQQEADTNSLQKEQGVKLSFTKFYDFTPEPTFKNAFPEPNIMPVTTHVYWQLNTVGGKKKSN